MNDLDKSKEELLKELQKLKEENELLKTSSKFDISDRTSVEKALANSETRYRRLFETAKEGILILDAKTGMIVDVNPFLIQLLGYSKERFIEKAIWEIGFLSDLVANKENFFELQKMEYIRYEDMPLETADGRTISVEFISNVYPVNHHNVIQCNIRDITNRKNAERLQSLSNEILSVLNSNLNLKEMIVGVLKLIQQETKFSAVGIRLKDGTDFPYFAQNGFSEDFLLTENTLNIKDRDGGICRDQDGNPILECTCGMVITGKTDRSSPFLTKAGSFWTINSYPLLELPLDKDPRDNPRNNCIHAGYGSVALIPIRTIDNIVGILQLNEKKTGAFTCEMICFFEGVGEMIATALMRRQAEESTAAFALRNQTLLLTASDGIHVLDEQGHVVEANLTFCKMLGYTRDELLQLNVSNWDVQWTAEELKVKIRELIAHPIVFETRHRRKNGKIIIVEINGIGVTLEGCNFLYASARDITDRKRNEQLLLDSNNRYKHLSDQLDAILDHIPGLIFYKDKKNNFIRVNKYVAEAYRKTKQDLEGINLAELYPSEIAEKYYQDDLSVINSGIAKLNIEEPWETAEGNKWVSTSKIPFVDESGIIIGVIGISLDITGRKQAEAVIQLKNDELINVVAEKDKFFSIIAHDLRNPFNSLLGFTKLLEDELPMMTQQESIKIAGHMRKSATNLFRLLENLLEWSQVKQGLIPFSPEKIQLNELVESIMPIALEPATNKMIEIIFSIPADIYIFADGNMLQSVIRNLVSNAIKFTPKGGRVSVTAKTIDNDSVEFSITDTGIGMNSSMVDNLFRLDVQTNRTGTEGEPTCGLGLIIIKDFIEKHGGDLWVVSEEGKGSTFYFTLPNQKG